MIKRTCVFGFLLIVLCWTFARAQGQIQGQIVDMLANKVIQKYQQASCDQLAQKKSEPKSPKEQEVLQRLKDNPEMRTAFINKVAAPVANKLFDCGLLP